MDVPESMLCEQCRHPIAPEDDHVVRQVRDEEHSMPAVLHRHSHAEGDPACRAVPDQRGPRNAGFPARRRRAAEGRVTPLSGPMVTAVRNFPRGRRPPSGTGRAGGTCRAGAAGTTSSPFRPDAPLPGARRRCSLPRRQGRPARRGPATTALPAVPGRAQFRSRRGRVRSSKEPMTAGRCSTIAKA